MSQGTWCLSNGNVKGWLLCDWAGLGWVGPHMYQQLPQQPPPPRFQGKKWRAGGTKEARSTSIYSRIWPGLSACAGSAAGQVPIFATVAVSSCSIFTHPFLSSSLLWRGPSPKSCNVFLISIFQVAGRDPGKDNEIIFIVECKAMQGFPVCYFSPVDSDHATDNLCLLIFLTSQTHRVCPRQYPDVIRPEVPVPCKHREWEIFTRTAEK